jgi:hypothetical protein
MDEMLGGGLPMGRVVLATSEPGGRVGLQAWISSWGYPLDVLIWQLTPRPSAWWDLLLAKLNASKLCMVAFSHGPPDRLAKFYPAVRLVFGSDRVTVVKNVVGETEGHSMPWPVED